MFQAQPTPYNPFASSYGVVSDDVGYSFPPTSLVLDSGGPIIFQNPTFNPAGNQYLPAAPTLHLNHNARFNNMETPPDERDLANQEEMARQYRPDLKGPLVGIKKSSQAITEEYAKADPIYVAKTSTLPRKYSHYRPVLGDGNCGWRALGFCYFETLLKLGDKEQVDMEYARMMSMTTFVVQMCGHEDWTFEDMRDECLELLKEIQAIIHLPSRPDSNLLILERFNDKDRSDQIVYWFRLLASAYLKSNAAVYQNFISDLGGVHGYSKDVLEPPNTEIEHLGMTLLIEVLLKPINVSVEIVYLDRSEGTEANAHTVTADNAAPGGPMVHLLYRPGHYDILYKEPQLQQQRILAQAAESSSIQVQRAASFSHRLDIQSAGLGYHQGDMSILAEMPFLSGAPPPSNHGLFTSDVSFEPTPASSYSLGDSLAPSPGAGISPTSPLSPGSGTAIFPSTTLPMHPHPLTAEATQSQFRPSKYEYETYWRDIKETPTFQTSTFKNSHYNTAHYNNPNFQPEAWTPDCEEALGKLGRDRHRSS